MDTTEESPVILSLCSGMCGLERGIERAIGKLKIAAYVEVEAFIIENLLSLMEQGTLDPAPVWANLKTFPAEPFHGKIHGIIGGYPCQPFSLAGQRKGTDDPRHLWPYIKELVRTIRPIWCFFENVPGHLTLGFREVKYDLEELGYTVEPGIYSAEEAGAPHQRKRLFIRAVQTELDNSACLGHGRQKHKVCAGRNAFKFTNEELGNPAFPNKQRDWLRKEYSERKTGRSGYEELGDTTSLRSLRVCEDRRTVTENEDREESRLHELARASSLSNSKLTGLEGLRNTRESQKSQSWDFCDEVTKWSARPGEEQHEWEEPRTITKEEFESRLGSPTHGYNFREDLLRMYGNGVVEQTAEIAFRDLMKRFGV